jgi:hypothetical protein
MTSDEQRVHDEFETRRRLLDQTRLSSALSMTTTSRETLVRSSALG